MPSLWDCRPDRPFEVYDELSGETLHVVRRHPYVSSNPGGEWPTCSTCEGGSEVAERARTRGRDRFRGQRARTFAGTSARFSTRSWSAASTTATTTAPATWPGIIEQARLPPVAGGGLPLAAALLPVAAARRRLRHQRLLDGAARVRAIWPTPSSSSRRPTGAGIRVIADLVMNHTSDQHPWFQESRQDRTNPKADWYVWSDDDHRYSDARVIFVDTEKSNWALDPSGASTTGTASSRTSPTSTTTTPRWPTP